MSKAKKTAALAALAVLLVLGSGAARTAPRDTQTKDLPVTPGSRVAFDLRSGGDIEILGADVTTAKVEYSVQADEADDYDITVMSAGGGLEIRTRAKFRDGDSHGVNFRLTLPRKFDVELDSMGGGLSIENLEGTFSGKTMGGELVLRGVRGRARLTTMGGEIRLTDAVLDGYLKTMGGEVLFRNVTGDVDGSSLGGIVRYENVQGRDGRHRAPDRVSESGLTAKTVVLSTMGGEIDVDAAPEGAKVHTMGGPVRVSGAEKFVKATTMGGNMRITVRDGWIDATTMAGDIEAVVEHGLGGGDQGVSLESKSGDIVLTVPAGIALDFDVTIEYTKGSRQDFKIVSDFPLQEERTKEWERPRWGSHGEENLRKYVYGKGATGAGGVDVKIKTVNGDVTIRKGR